MSLVGVGLTPVLVPLCHTPSMIVLGVRLTIHLVRSLSRHWVLVICSESDQLFSQVFVIRENYVYRCVEDEVIVLRLFLIYMCVCINTFVCMNLNYLF